MPVYKQLINTKTLNDLKLKVESCNWQIIRQSNNADAAMSSYLLEFRQLYKVYSYLSVNKGYKSNIPWLTTGLIKSMGRKK